MTILPFSTRQPGTGERTAAERAWLIEMEAALSGERDGAEAQSWRQLREDVRSLTPPIDLEFEQGLQRQVTAWTAPERRRRQAGRRHRGPLGRLRPAGARPHGLVGMGSAASAAVAIVVALLLVAPWQSQAPSGSAGSGARSGSGATAGAESSPTASAGAANGPLVPRPAPRPSAPGAHQAPEAAAAEAASPQAAEQPPPYFGFFSKQAGTPRRVQHLSASLTLASPPSEVQQVSDRAAQIAVEDHGFVRVSHVDVQHKGGSEATLTLSLPSGRLDAAIASLERLASVRSKSQSLLDITNSYDAAQRQLADAKAERQALLRALAQAVTQGEIESLHARLSDARRSIEAAEAGLRNVSHRASTAEVEVSVLGETEAGGEGITLSGGLHDAGHMLTVALVVLLIGAAVLMPLALLVALLTLTHRVWRRHRRERALDAA